MLISMVRNLLVLLGLVKVMFVKFYLLLHVRMINRSKFYVELISNHEFSQLRHRTIKYTHCRYYNFAKITCACSACLSTSQPQTQVGSVAHAFHQHLLKNLFALTTNPSGIYLFKFNKSNTRIYPKGTMNLDYSVCH